MSRQGYDSYIAVVNEVTWGTKVVAGMDFMEFLSETINATIEEKIVQGLNKSRVRTKRVQGAKLVAGDISWEVNPEDGIGDFLKHTLSTENLIDDGVGNGGQHVFTPGATLPVGLTVQKCVGGLAFDNFGGRISQLSFNFQSGELLQATVSCSFQDEDDGTPQAVSYDTQPPLVYHTGTIEVDGSAAEIISANVGIVTGLKQDRRKLGSNLILQQQPGMFGVTGQITKFYADNTFINKFRNATAAKLSFELTGALIGTTLRKLKIVIPVAFFNGENAKVGGPDDIQLTLPFVAIKDGSGTPDELVEVTLNNSRRTIY